MGKSVKSLICRDKPLDGSRGNSLFAEIMAWPGSAAFGLESPPLKTFRAKQVGRREARLDTSPRILLSLRPQMQLTFPLLSGAVVKPEPRLETFFFLFLLP